MIWMFFLILSSVKKELGNYNSFQLCYNKQSNEHALTWRKEHSIEHFQVDSGEPEPLKNLSPIMMELLISISLFEILKSKAEK